MQEGGRQIPELHLSEVSEGPLILSTPGQDSLNKDKGNLLRLAPPAARKGTVLGGSL